VESVGALPSGESIVGRHGQAHLLHFPSQCRKVYTRWLCQLFAGDRDFRIASLLPADSEHRVFGLVMKVDIRSPNIQPAEVDDAKLRHQARSEISVPGNIARSCILPYALPRVFKLP
jgi:hypothetical protein